MNRVQAALELRKALQFFLATLDVETQAEAMLEVASVFPAFEVGKTLKFSSRVSFLASLVSVYGELKIL